MQTSELVKKYLDEKQIMQLATVRNGRPWICSIHFVSDDDGTLYWVSSPGRRHSLEIADDSKAAAAVMVKGPEHPVVGIQIEGDAYLVEAQDEIEKAMKLYGERHHVSKNFYKAVITGTAAEKLYKLVPRAVVLFDEENFADDPRREYTL